MRALPLSRTRRIAMVSLFTALAVATDYAMQPIPNVKLMDSMVFVSSLAFGFGVGASVGALTWLVYGTVNPLGADSAFLLALLILSEMVYAALGVVARRLLGAGEPGVPLRSLLWGALGMIGAFLYDVNTIVTPYLVAGEPLSAALASLPFAAPFMIAHEVSDGVFFATVAPLLYLAVRRVVKAPAAVAAAPRPARATGSPADPARKLDEKVHR